MTRRSVTTDPDPFANHDRGELVRDAWRLRAELKRRLLANAEQRELLTATLRSLDDTFAGQLIGVLSIPVLKKENK